MPIVNCLHCNKKFKKLKYEIKRSSNHFCSLTCNYDFKHNKIILNCEECGIEIEKYQSQINQTKFGKNFCSLSCVATYNNKHKTYGTRRSKLEEYLEVELKKEFPELTIDCNNKQIIGSELDFYFPTLNLAIEINGIFHYEPIFGKDKLLNIQNNDKAKLRACNQNKIDLISIPTIYNHLSNDLKLQYLKQIIIIINNNN